MQAICITQIKEFNKAIEINKNDFEVYLKRGIAKYKLADYNGAISDLDLSIHLQPSANAYYYRGIAKIRINLKAAGCDDLKQSETLGNTSARQDIEQNCIK